MRHLLDVADLGRSGIETILDMAREASRIVSPVAPLMVGLVFLDSSLRTRVGFATATVRLGGIPIEVSEPRWSERMSAIEPFPDTLRTVSGMVHVLVTRVPFRLDREMVRRTVACPLINGGDVGGEHPTQALIDLFAMRNLVGPVEGLHVGICGDLTTRVVHSLLQAFTYVPPRRLTLFAPPLRRQHTISLPSQLSAVTETRDEVDFSGLDVLHLPGLPMGQGADRLDTSARAAYALTEQSATTMRDDTVVLSPMPVVDEIADNMRADPRVRIFDQSDRAVDVRTAALAWVQGG